jgi:hypothetical protein
VDNKRYETPMNFRLGSPMHLKLGLYVSYTQGGSYPHTLKDLVLWGSLTKTTWISSNILIQHQKGNNIYCHKHPLHQHYSHILTLRSKAKLTKTKIFVRRLRPQPPYILTRRIIIPIHPHLLNCHIHLPHFSSTNQWNHATYYFPFMDESLLVWNLFPMIKSSILEQCLVPKLVIT